MTGLLNNFQLRVQQWMQTCFGPEISADKKERNHRFLEEALELVQSLDCTREEALLLVDYVYNRPIGQPRQECGGVMVTLAALCTPARIDMALEGVTELDRIWQFIPQIRAKQAAKPRNSPLPIVVPDVVDVVFISETESTPILKFCAGHTNTGCVTIKQGKRAIPITRNGEPLKGGDIKAGEIITFNRLTGELLDA